MKAGAWLGVVAVIAGCGDARSTVATAVLEAARATAATQTSAPVIPVRLPPFEIAPPADRIVALHDDCVTHKSGAVTCWGDAKVKPDVAPGIRCQLHRNHHVTCTEPSSSRAHEVEGLDAVKVFAMGPATEAGAAACALHVADGLVCYRLYVEDGGVSAYPRDDRGLEVDAFEGATALAVGADGTGVAAIVDGRVVTFDGTRTRTLPKLTDAVAVTDHCALRAQGSVVCWGNHDLGQKRVARTAVPGPVVGVANARSIASGTTTGWAVTRDGRLYRWGGGRGWARVVDEIRDATAVAVAADDRDAEPATGRPDTACVVRRAGRVSCVDAALHVTDLDLGGARAVAIAGGASGFVLGMSDGTVQRALLDGGATPTLERVEDMQAVVEVAGEASYACGRTRDGAVWCASGRVSARRVHESGAVEIAAGDDMGCARSETGGVTCWQHDAIAHGVGEVAVTDAAVALAVGRGGPCLARADGSLGCWPSHAVPPTPASVLPAGSVGTTISGGHDGCTIAADRRVLCWGENREGRLGDGSVFQLDTPAGVPLWEPPVRAPDKNHGA